MKTATVVAMLGALVSDVMVIPALCLFAGLVITAFLTEDI